LGSRLPCLLKGFDKTEHCYALALLSHLREIVVELYSFFIKIEYIEPKKHFEGLSIGCQVCFE
jgi:hypothetical protein